jgi:hypothetical protein
MSDVRAEVPAAGVDRRERVAEARARLRQDVTNVVPSEPPAETPAD